MKVLKIAGVAIIVLVALVFVGGFIFLKTLDVNKYLPMVKQQVKQAVGRDLKIGKADLKFSLSRGISLEVSGIALSDDPVFSDKDFLSVDKVFLGLDLKPLILQRKVQIARITAVAPKVVVIRNKDGLINAAMMAPASSGKDEAKNEGQKGGPEKMQALPALLVENIELSNASVTYLDEMFSPRIALTVDHIDLAVKGFSLTEPFSFGLKANLFSQEPDLEISGKARLALSTASALVTDARLDLDMAKVSAVQLNSMLPMAAPAGLKDPLKGKLALSVPELRAGASGLQSLKVSGSLSGGQVISALIPLPVTDIALNFEGDQKDLFLRTGVFRFAEGLANVSGVVRGYMSAPAVEISGNIKGLGLGPVAEAYKIPAKINGKADADVKLSLSGKTPQEIISSLKAEIAGSLKDGVLEGLNLVQTGLGNIPMLPTLWEMVQPSLPPETQEDVKKGRTLIETAEVLAHMNGMTANVDRAEIVTRDVGVSAKGTVQVPEALNLVIDIHFQKEITSALVHKVSDLAALQDDQGKLYIPLKLKGPMLKPKAEPDVEYLSKKLLLNRGKEALEKVIDKNPQVKGVLDAILGTPKTDTGTSQGAAQGLGGTQESQVPEKGTQSEASKAVDSIFNSLLKNK